MSNTQREDEQKLNDIQDELMAIVQEDMQMEAYDLMSRIRNLVNDKDNEVYQLERQLKGL